MKNRRDITVDLENPSTWIKFKKNLCNDCMAGCCSLPVEVKTDDLARMGVIDEFECDEPPKKIAKRLKKQGIVDHFNFKNSVFTLSRLANDDCIYLDSRSRRCSIYHQRPHTCRNHPQVGPRSGFCAYCKKIE